jgi:hypothetical protein
MNMRPPTSFEPIRYRICWIRESTASAAEVDLGLEISASELVPVLAGLRPADGPALGPSLLTEEGLADIFGSRARAGLLPVAAERRLMPMFGRLTDAEQFEQARAGFRVLAELAARIRSAGPVSGNIEVHLPFMDRRAWTRRFEHLGKLDFVPYSGRLMPRALVEQPQRMTEHNAMLAACTPVGCRAAFTIAGFDRTIPGALSSVLRTSPAERHPSYFPAMCGATVAVQRTIRRWMENYWISDLDHFANADRTWPVLAYVSSQPFPGRRPDEFTHDLLSPDWIHSVLRGSRDGLRSRLRFIQAELAKAGRSEVAVQYQESMSKDILAWVRRQRRFFQNLVAQEISIVNAFVKWTRASRNAATIRETANACESMANDVHCCLRRLPGAPASEQLASLILVEALHALHQRLGGTAELQQIPVPEPVAEGTAVPFNAPADQERQVSEQCQ